MDNIFGHFIGHSDDKDPIRLAYASWFCEVLPSAEFSGEELLFWYYMDYSAKLNAPLRSKYFDVWLNTELRALLHQHNIHVTGCEAMNFEDPVIFETAVKSTTDIMKDNFTVLENMQFDLDDFKLEMSAFMLQRRNKRLTEALSKTYDILNSTDSATNASEYALDTINIINELYDVDALEELNTDTSTDSNMTKMKFVCDSGLPAIDKDSGGLYTTQLLGIEAQSGTGKTRFALGAYIHRAATVYKQNCLFYTLEQTKEEIEAMLVARHIYYLYKLQITDSMIVKGKVPKEYQSTVDAARFDLFESGKYGKIHIEAVDLYLETFITKMRNADKLHGPFKLIVIDYMGIIDSRAEAYRKEKSEYEIIKTAFRLFKRYLRKNDKAGIAISQFNREGVQAGKADKEITTEMAQGGLAVYKNTDYNIAISMTDTMKLQQKRRFSQPKVRSSQGFGTFLTTTRLGICWFQQIEQKEV